MSSIFPREKQGGRLQYDGTGCSSGTTFIGLLSNSATTSISLRDRNSPDVLMTGLVLNIRYMF
jgi:hypothetical protein